MGNILLPSLRITVFIHRGEAVRALSWNIARSPEGFEVMEGSGGNMKANKTIYWARVFGSMEWKQGHGDNPKRPRQILLSLLKELWAVT
jgi:hypothetical protein